MAEEIVKITKVSCSRCGRIIKVKQVDRGHLGFRYINPDGSTWFGGFYSFYCPACAKKRREEEKEEANPLPNQIIEGEP